MYVRTKSLKKHFDFIETVSHERGSTIQEIIRSNFPGCISGERNLEARARLAELSLGVWHTPVNFLPETSPGWPNWCARNDRTRARGYAGSGKPSTSASSGCATGHRFESALRVHITLRVSIEGLKHSITLWNALAADFSGTHRWGSASSAGTRNRPRRNVENIPNSKNL